MEIKGGVFTVTKEDIEKAKEMKSWWPGDPRVEEFMPAVSAAIKKNVPGGSTEIYNRCYEAVYAAIQKYDRTKKAGEV